MKCSCGNEIGAERESLGLMVCYSCALKIPRVKGIMVVDGKSFVDMLVVSEKEHARCVLKHRLSGNPAPPY